MYRRLGKWEPRILAAGWFSVWFWAFASIAEERREMVVDRTDNRVCEQQQKVWTCGMNRPGERREESK